MAYELRVMIIFVIVLGLFRFMGKRTMSQLTNYDVASIFIIGTVASGPLVTAGIGKTIYGLAILFFLHLGVIIFSRNQKFRNYIYGEPKILIEKGKISRKMLKSAKLTLPELIDELRNMGYYNVADVEFAILENTGKITTVPKGSNGNHPIGNGKKEKDLKLPLVMDGKVLSENIKYAGYDMDWLLSTLEHREIFNIRDISLATLDKNGLLYVDKYKD